MTQPKQASRAGTRPTELQVADDVHVTELLDRATADLQPQFQWIFGPETIRAIVDETYAQFNATARVHTRLATLATRFAANA